DIAERFFLGMDSQLELTFNPKLALDRIVSHGNFDFQGESQPLLIEELGKDRPKDVLCRLQMPPIGEYTVPNNRGCKAVLEAALNQGERYWMLYAGPLETKVPTDRTSVFYGLQGRFSEMRV